MSEPDRAPAHGHAAARVRLVHLSPAGLARYIRDRLEGRPVEPAARTAHGEYPHDFLCWAYRTCESDAFRERFEKAVDQQLHGIRVASQRAFWLLRLVEELGIQTVRDEVSDLVTRAGFDRRPTEKLDTHAQALAAALVLGLEKREEVRVRLERDLGDPSYAFLAYEGLRKQSHDDAVLRFTQLLALIAREADPPVADLRGTLLLASDRWPEREIPRRTAREVRRMSQAAQRLFEQVAKPSERLRQAWAESATREARPDRIPTTLVSAFLS